VWTKRNQSHKPALRNGSSQYTNVSTSGSTTASPPDRAGGVRGVLQRWEEDYQRDRPGLVRDAMTTLWAARRGLSESEPLELLGTGGQALARAHWSPLYLAAEQSLVVRSGLIGFFHDFLREAVR